MNPLRWLSVSLSHATVEAPTVLSLIGCTRLRAVSGILRTQRGRRGSRGAGQHAGTGSAGPCRRGRPGPISTDLASRPCGSSLPLAPVAQVSRSLLWINPRPCGSTLAGVGQCPTATGHGCPAGLRAGVPDRRSVSPLSSSLGAVGRARAGAAVRRSPSAPFFGGPATVGAGPLMCADGWDVTVWRTVSAARPRQSRGHRTERGQLVHHRHGTTAVALSAKLASSPGRTDPARPSAVAAHLSTGKRPVPRDWSHRPTHYSPGQGPRTTGRRRSRRNRPGPHRRIGPGAGDRAARSTGRQPEMIMVSVHPGRDLPRLARKVPVERQPNSGPSPLYR